LKKAPKSTSRGVFVVDKSGKVLAAQQGKPEQTVDVVRKLVGGDTGDVEAAKVADEVADSAAKVDA
jgi:thioredoxin-dependent peroxiredoxin